ncbi:MAG: DUF378 domain-containing protein [bacterium]|nr:DUF378 domain-containing protein [bacterium]
MTGQTCTGTKVAQVLLIIGGINWGLVGLGTLLGKGDWNVVHALVGQWMTVEMVVYVLVGLAAILCLVSWAKCCGGKCSVN